MTAAADLETRIERVGRAARTAGRILAASEAKVRNKALAHAQQLLRERVGMILDANARDMEAAQSMRNAAFLDRLALDAERVEALAVELEHIEQLPELLGQVEGVRTRDNGLKIGRMRVPIGVIGMIYEARPGVTAEAAALCIKAGNSVILRGGSEAQRSNKRLADCMKEGLRRGPACRPKACSCCRRWTGRRSTRSSRWTNGSI